MATTTTLLGKAIQRSITRIAAADLEGCEYIGPYAFAYCSRLSSVEIPDTVTSIGDYAFYGSNLYTLRIGSGITSIGSYALSGFAGWSLYINAIDPPTITDTTFTGTYTVSRIWVPSGSVTAYKQAQYWSAFANKIVAQ